jgi:sirohydrochlorin ferrochelatase
VPDPQTTGVILLGRGSSDAGANGELARMARWIFEENDHELVDLAFTGVTWPRLETVVQRQVKLGMTQICVIPVYLFTGVLIERINGQLERLKQQYPQVAFALGSTSASSRRSSPARPAAPATINSPKARCSNATAASTAKPPKPSICTTTAIRDRRLRAHAGMQHDHGTQP